MGRLGRGTCAPELARLLGMQVLTTAPPSPQVRVLRSWRLLGMFTRVDHEAARHDALDSYRQLDEFLISTPEIPISTKLGSLERTRAPAPTLDAGVAARSMPTTTLGTTIAGKVCVGRESS